MPYSDPEKQKEAKRKWARKHRAERNLAKILNEFYWYNYATYRSK